jgi:Fur family ferric uptake transcriptional regulator
MDIQKRRTVQKSAIEDALLRARGHVSAEELHLLVRKHLPKISIGTIYRNLKSLVSEGKALKVIASDGLLLFEPVSEKHHHLRCVSCNRVVNCSIESADLLAIARKASLESGFLVKDISVTLEGFCSHCEAALNK